MDREKNNAAQSEKDQNTEKASGRMAEPRTVEADSAASEPRRSLAEQNQACTRLSQNRFSSLSRRELLKVAPVLVLGAFAIPSWRESVLRKGLGFSDWVSRQLFRRGHLAPTFLDSELTPLEEPRMVVVREGQVVLKFSMPRQSVSLVRLSW